MTQDDCSRSRYCRNGPLLYLYEIFIVPTVDNFFFKNILNLYSIPLIFLNTIEIFKEI